MRYPVLNRKLR